VAALSLLAILLHGLVDDPLYTSRAAVFLLIPLAFIPPAAPAQGHRPSRRSLVAVAVFLTLLLAVGFALRRPLLSVAYANLGAVRQTRAELSRYSWPEWPIQDELRRNVDLTPAISAYQRALALHPLNSTANRRLGQIELSLGQYGPALTHLQAAYGVEASVNTTRQLLGEAYLANGDLLRGAALWSGVANDVGQLQGRIWWYEHIGLKTVAGWMTEALP
jgi:tetratricopeptide (TPR) repeat protein